MLEDLWLRIQEGTLIVIRSFQELPWLKRLILLICLVSFIPAFFITKYSSLALWNYNYREYRVVAKESFSNPQSLEVDSAKVLSVSEGNFAAYAKVKNPNLDLAFQNTSYEFSFENSSGEVLKTVKGNFYILPNEEKYLITPTVELLSENPSTVSLKLGDIKWQKKVSIPKITFRSPFPDVYDSLNPLELVAEGVVVNSSPYDLGKIRITFLVKDFNDEVIAVAERTEFTVKAGERRAYVQRWPNIYKNEVSKVVVNTETNALDGNNLVLENLPTAPGSSLSRPEGDGF